MQSTDDMRRCSDTFQRRWIDIIDSEGDEDEEGNSSGKACSFEVNREASGNDECFSSDKTFSSLDAEREACGGDECYYSDKACSSLDAMGEAFGHGVGSEKGSYSAHGAQVFDLTGLDFIDDEANQEEWYNEYSWEGFMRKTNEVEPAVDCLSEPLAHSSAEEAQSGMSSASTHPLSFAEAAYSFYYVPDLQTSPTHAVYFLPEQPIRSGIHRSLAKVCARNALDSVYSGIIRFEAESERSSESSSEVGSQDCTTMSCPAEYVTISQLNTHIADVKACNLHSMEQIKLAAETEISSVLQATDEKLHHLTVQRDAALSKLVQVNTELAKYKETCKRFSEFLNVDFSDIHEFSDACVPDCLDVSVHVQGAKWDGAPLKHNKNAKSSSSSSDISLPRLCEDGASVRIAVINSAFDWVAHGNAYGNNKNIADTLPADSAAAADVGNAGSPFCSSLPSLLSDGDEKSKSGSPPHASFSKPAIRRGGRKHNKHKKQQQQQLQQPKQQQTTSGQNILAPNMSAECEIHNFCDTFDLKSSPLRAPGLSAESNDLRSCASNPRHLLSKSSTFYCSALNMSACSTTIADRASSADHLLAASCAVTTTFDSKSSYPCSAPFLSACSTSSADRACDADPLLAANSAVTTASNFGAESQ